MPVLALAAVGQATVRTLAISIASGSGQPRPGQGSLLLMTLSLSLLTASHGRGRAAMDGFEHAQELARIRTQIEQLRVASASPAAGLLRAPARGESPRTDSHAFPLQ